MSKTKVFITAKDMSEMLGISEGHAYKLIRRLNSELEKQGYIVIAGKLPARYFEERYYGLKSAEN